MDALTMFLIALAVLTAAFVLPRLSLLATMWKLHMARFGEVGALVFDLIAPQELVGYIRGLAYEANLYQFHLSQYLPERLVSDTEFRIVRGSLQDQDAATYRAFDTESPIAGRLPGSRITGTIPPISRKIPLGEEATLRLRQIQSGDSGELVAAIYNDAANMTRSVLARLELARGEALHSGQIVLNENGVAGTINFGRKSGHSVTAGTLWSDTTNADPLLDLQTWVNTYVTSNGIYPAYALISTTILTNLMRNAKLKSTIYPTGGPGVLSVDAIQALFASYQLPQLVVINEQVRVDGTATRVLPVNKLVLMPPDSEPLGNTLYGLTADAITLVEKGYLVQEQAPGIVTVISAEDDPVATWTKASALALPIIANPDLTFAAVVG